MKKWVFFDVMGVVFVVGDDTNDLLVPFVRERNPSISIEKINEAYMEASVGNLSSLEFWSLMGFEICEYPKIQMEYLDSKLRLDEHVPKVFEELQQNYNIGLLSNDLSEWSKYLRIKYDLDKFLKCSIISGDVKCRKPQKRIYEIMLKQVNCLAKDCVFIDDRIKNLYPALELGMNVVKFNREEDVATTLDFPQVNSITEIPDIVHSILNSEVK